jgi:hypothetical protein
MSAGQAILAGFVGGFASAMTTSFFRWWRKDRVRP